MVSHVARQVMGWGCPRGWWWWCCWMSVGDPKVHSYQLDMQLLTLVASSTCGHFWALQMWSATASPYFGDLWSRNPTGVSVKYFLIHLAMILSSCYWFPPGSVFLSYTNQLKGQQLLFVGGCVPLTIKLWFAWLSGAKLRWQGKAVHALRRSACGNLGNSLVAKEMVSNFAYCEGA